MKAMQIDRFGGPEVLHAAEIAEPAPGKGQVRVQLEAVGVNPFDAKVRAGLMESQFKTKLPAILGNEIAGTVDALGEGVTNLQIGDEVFGWSDGGAYAEKALATLVVKRPADLSIEQAAALPVAGETANRVLETLQLKAGETLLIHGGAGVVGSAGIQLARARGAEVIATGNEKNQEAIRALGATPVVYGPGLVERVRAAGKKIDAVFDAAGKGALPDSIELRGGTSRIVTIADADAAKHGVIFSVGTGKQRSIAVLEQIGSWASEGKLRIAVAQVLPLGEAARAHQQLESGHAPGKILLKP